jgi:hypothetical protein
MSKICRENSCFIKLGQHHTTLKSSYKTNVSDKVGENIKAHILCSKTFLENRAFYYIKKYCRTWQATDENMADVHCLLVTWGYGAFGKSLCTYKMCWKWCPRASMQAWTRLILFANTFCRSVFGKSLCTYEMCWKMSTTVYTSLNSAARSHMCPSTSYRCLEFRWSPNSLGV